MPDSRFCEECGAEVEDFADVSKGNLYNEESHEIFDGSEWRKDWDSVASNSYEFEVGLILTRENSLLGQLSATSSQLRDVINCYIKKALLRGAFLLK